MPIASQPPFDQARAHRWFAVEANNLAWDLAAVADRPADDTARMLHAAHAAYFHWAAVGTPLNRLRAAVLLVTAYVSANRIKESVVYADQALELLPAVAEVTAFDRATAYASAALAFAAGRPEDSRRLRRDAWTAARALDADDRATFDRFYPGVAAAERDNAP